MSAKSVDGFFAKVAEDKSLQTKLAALHKKTVKQSQEVKDKASAQVVKIAAAAGFKISLKDLAAARAGKGSKLAQAELREVTGQQMQCDNSIYSYCTMQNWTCMRGSWY